MTAIPPVTDHLRSLVLAAPSLRSVSRATGISYSTVHKFANGGSVDGATIDRLAQHYRVSLGKRRTTSR